MTDGSDDPYAVLGVPCEATPAELKAAFRRLAKEMHPDQNPNRTSVRFGKVFAAYQLLSDPVKRADYDRRTRSAPRDRPPGETPRREAKAAPNGGPQDAKGASADPKTARGNAPPPPSPTAGDVAPEREVLRDASILVTDRRVVFPDGVEYTFARIRSVQLVSDERNAFALLFALLALVIAIGLVAVPARLAASGAALCCGHLVVTFVRKRPAYWVRVGTDGERRDATFSFNPAWTRDVVDAIGRGIGRAPLPLATRVGAARHFFGALVAFVGYMLGVALLRVLSTTTTPPASTPVEVVTAAPEMRTSEQASPIWTRVELGVEPSGRFTVDMPAPPKQSFDLAELGGSNGAGTSHQVTHLGVELTATVVDLFDAAPDPAAGLRAARDKMVQRLQQRGSVSMLVDREEDIAAHTGRYFRVSVSRGRSNWTSTLSVQLVWVTRSPAARLIALQALVPDGFDDDDAVVERFFASLRLDASPTR